MVLLLHRVADVGLVRGDGQPPRHELDQVRGGALREGNDGEVVARDELAVAETFPLV